MTRRIAIVALALGTVLGYGSGIAHIAYARAHHHWHCAASERAEPPGTH